ncbi:hypothetical protein KP626_07735 [Christensenella sp. MSJ-20]|uniref:BTAD domain-containing putative transcriptional regulator n=1 Tax=Christensenella sp. MSJ-20 TaxID=2841518 RepID=UPI001C75DF1E|nr:hypothetical protein KP626_07735 [Christensenella sp. MSJ-20]
MENGRFIVRMLGGFSVYYGERPIVSERSRNSKVTQLLEYLLMNRRRGVPQEELIEVLLAGEESESPANVLKNLIYRLRKLFIAADLPGDSCIYFQNGCYGFTQQIPCWMDVEAFEEAIAIARRTADREKKFGAYLEAMDLYQGDFLPRLLGETWAMVPAVRYQDLYRSCIQEAYALLSQSREISRLLGPIRRATTLYPYDESLHILYISCLFQLQRYKEAVAEYDRVVNLLFDDLGVGPSEELQELFQRITGKIQPLASSLDAIREDMSEGETQTGAYQCNFHDFTSTYRFVVRHIERSGQSAFLMLCSVTQWDGSVPAGGKDLREVSRAFQDAVRNSLRRGDICTRYSPSQFLLLLMDINQENCKVVANRIRDQFLRNIRRRDLRVHSKAISVVDIGKSIDQSVIGTGNLSWQ